MFHSTEYRSQHQFRNRTAFVSSLVAVLALFCASQLGAQTVANYSFEDGTADGWTSFNGASTPVATYTFEDGGLDGWAPFGSPTLTNTTPPVPGPNNDTNALLVTNRTAGFMGPSLNLLSVNGVVAGATYQVSAYILLAAPDSTNPTATLTTKTTNCANTSGAFANLGTSAALSSSAWTKVQGTFSFSNLPGPPTSLLLYIQSNSATDSFYITDVSIGEISPPPPNPSQQDNSGITTTFEDGGLDGWSSRTANSTLTNTSAQAHGGSNSLLISGRTADYDGPQINVSNKMYNGSVYNLSVWVRLLPTDGSSHVVNMSLQATLNGTESFPGITGYPGVLVLADGNWHQISVMGYNMSNSYDPGAGYVYLQSVPPSGTDLVSFYIDDFQLTYVMPPTIQTNIPSIYKTLSAFFPVGAAVDPIDLSGPHSDLLTMHFDSITSGNDMKWSSVENTKGTFNFGNADQEVGLAQCHDMRVRGHNLVWASGQQTPSYATGDGTNSPENQALVTANIQEHIKSEVQHFDSKVYAWDVVNEPLDPNQPDCLLHGPFYKVLGPSYIDIALQAARQYAPAGTKLFINDYSTADPKRLACLVQLLSDLRTRSIPIDAVGHEMHNAINYPSTAAMINAINTVANNFPDLDQQVTELDMSIYNAGDRTSNYGNNVPASLLAEQAWLYAQYFDAFRQLSGKLSAVTLWGFADDDTWLDSFPVVRTDYPLPFDLELQAKPAYWGIVDPTQLPGYGMTFSISSTAGQQNTRVLTVTATNGNVGPAYATQINGFAITQISGPPSNCRPTVTAPGSYPIALGDIATGGSASAAFTVRILGCDPLTQFSVSVPWSSAIYETGTFVSTINFDRGQ